MVLKPALLTHQLQDGIGSCSISPEMMQHLDYQKVCPLGLQEFHPLGIMATLCFYL
jgi:hypothetical protein